jgi:hypothetical protein
VLNLSIRIGAQAWVRKADEDDDAWQEPREEDEGA